MKDVRVVEGGGWFTATIPQFPLIAGYGKTAEEAERRLVMELAARETVIRGELQRLEEVREMWAAERREFWSKQGAWVTFTPWGFPRLSDHAPEDDQDGGA